MKSSRRAHNGPPAPLSSLGWMKALKQAAACVSPATSATKPAAPSAVSLNPALNGFKPVVVLTPEMAAALEQQIGGQALFLAPSGSQANLTFSLGVPGVAPAADKKTSPRGQDAANQGALPAWSRMEASDDNGVELSQSPVMVENNNRQDGDMLEMSLSPSGAKKQKEADENLDLSFAAEESSQTAKRQRKTQSIGSLAFPDPLMAVDEINGCDLAMGGWLMSGDLDGLMTGAELPALRSDGQDAAACQMEAQQALHQPPMSPGAFGGPYWEGMETPRGAPSVAAAVPSPTAQAPATEANTTTAAPMADDLQLHLSSAMSLRADEETKTMFADLLADMCAAEDNHRVVLAETSAAAVAAGVSAAAELPTVQVVLTPPVAPQQHIQAAPAAAPVGESPILRCDSLPQGPGAASLTSPASTYNAPAVSRPSSAASLTASDVQEDASKPVAMASSAEALWKEALAALEESLQKDDAAPAAVAAPKPATVRSPALAMPHAASCPAQLSGTKRPMVVSGSRSFNGTGSEGNSPFLRMPQLALSPVAASAPVSPLAFNSSSMATAGSSKAPLVVSRNALRRPLVVSSANKRRPTQLLRIPDLNALPPKGDLGAHEGVENAAAANRCNSNNSRATRMPAAAVPCAVQAGRFPAGKPVGRTSVAAANGAAGKILEGIVDLLAPAGGDGAELLSALMEVVAQMPAGAR